MKEETIKRVEEETADWEYLKRLPAEISGFGLQKLMTIDGDTYKLFCYENTATSRSITAYFHEETHEYKVLEAVGLIEFCRIEFITGSIEIFTELLSRHLTGLLQSLAVFDKKTLGSIVLSQGILEWEYGRNLPGELEGFSLFIAPTAPLPITNGAYVIIDYSDFAIESSLTIYYNLYRDDYWGEARIRRIPDVSYIFDATDLKELEAKLEANMVPRLKEIRRRAMEVA
ncbi:MAG: hypothetical protein IJ849_12680 [Selenomonadaceae bacterium]|nr:hypothetical protein [Selenomonadaceae bacterium]